MNAITFENVFIENDDLEICNNISIKIKKEEMIYLTGKTGSGKSSVLKTLYGGHKIKSGNLNVMGFNMKTIKKHEIPLLRKKMGIIFQDFQLLYDRSLYENLSFVLYATGWGNKEKIKNRCEYILETIGLKDKIYDMPYKLSGGQQQKLCIGRALLNHPELIIADEPTGNLDSETSIEIMNLILKIHRLGKTIIIATHNTKIIELFPARELICSNYKIEDKK